MADTPQERLDAVETLIATIEADGLASTGIGAMSWSRVDLPKLYDERRKLLKEVAASRIASGYSPLFSLGIRPSRPSS